MSTFRGYSFKVVADSGRFPGLEKRAIENPPVYRATIKVSGADNRKGILESWSRGTFKQSLGADGWVAFIDNGVGDGVLTVPLTRALLVSWNSAVLVNYREASEPSMVAHEYFIDCEWAILDTDPFP
jgi:hypothetical protein